MGLTGAAASPIKASAEGCVGTGKLSWSQRQPAAGESVSSRLAAGGWFGCCPICFLATGAAVWGLPATVLGSGGFLVTMGPEVPRSKTQGQNSIAAAPCRAPCRPYVLDSRTYTLNNYTAAAPPTGASSISLEATSSSSTASDGHPRGTKIKTKATGAR